MKEFIRGKLKFLSCVLGIFGFYFLYGIIQERITRGKYGHDGKEERFTFILALVFCQCVVNYLYAIVVSKYILKQEDDTTKTSYYMVAALTYLTAMVTSNKALLWVNYPTQVVGKSCKPIPVMILGVLIARKRYPLRKYLFILMVVLGVALFMYKDKTKSSTSGSMFGYGELLLILSLTCDGVTGAVQERMKSEFNSKSGPMMKNMNLWSLIFLGAALVITGELWSFIAFIQRHPDAIPQLTLFCLTSALGQFFIYLCVADFGPLPCSIITTTRKFFTVLGSILFFGNSLSNRQWLGTTFVFTGLILDGMFGKSSGSTKPGKLN